MDLFALAVRHTGIREIPCQSCGQKSHGRRHVIVIMIALEIIQLNFGCTLQVKDVNLLDGGRRRRDST